jgi:hypothetical protein
VPAQEKTAAINSNGNYTVNVSGLTPPFILKAAGTDQTLYSMSKNGGRVNINPISDLAVAASADGTELSALYAMRSGDGDYYRTTTDNFDRIINSLRTVLAPLFELYGVSGNAVSDDDGERDDGDDDDSDSDALRALFRDVRFVVNDGRVTVTNRLTGAIIFSGSLRNLSAGTFYPENMPAGPEGSTACTSFTYSAWGACQSNNTQTRSLLTSSPSGCTGGSPVLSQACTYVPPTPTACTYTYGAWGACLSSGTQVRSLLTTSPAGCTGTPVLTRACTYVPPAPPTCTSFTYSAWGACQSNGTQTRSLLTSSPAGCTGGTPVLSQACTYVPPVTTCTSFTYSAWGACQSNNTQTRSLLTSSPAGCTGGTPVLSQACTYVPPSCTYTYSAWGACQSNNTQTRSLLTSSPAGCAGTPVLSQACTYVPPAPPTCTSFTYSAWGACQSNNTQTRTLLTSSPAGCTGGTPSLSQACTYVPPAPVCGSCHAIPPSSGRHSRHSFTSCATCHGTGYSSTTTNAATHMNGAVNIISTLNYNATTGSCGSPGCHGSRTW